MNVINSLIIFLDKLPRIVHIFVDIRTMGWYYIMRMPHDLWLKSRKGTRIGE